MKKVNQDLQLRFKKENIARLNTNDLDKIRGGEAQDTSDSVSFTVITSTKECFTRWLTISG